MPIPRNPLHLTITLFGAGIFFCLAIRFLLHHRTDYVGHFAAGYGGPLGLLTIDNAPPIQIEYGLFNQLNINDHIEKESWTRSLTINNTPATLPWSPDFIGIIILMPIFTLSLLFLTYRSTPRTTKP